MTRTGEMRICSFTLKPRSIGPIASSSGTKKREERLAWAGVSPVLLGPCDLRAAPPERSLESAPLAVHGRRESNLSFTLPSSYCQGIVLVITRYLEILELRNFGYSSPFVTRKGTGSPPRRIGLAFIEQGKRETFRPDADPLHRLCLHAHIRCNCTAGQTWVGRSFQRPGTSVSKSTGALTEPGDEHLETDRVRSGNRHLCRRP